MGEEKPAETADIPKTETQKPTETKCSPLSPLAGVRLAWALTGGFRKPEVIIGEKPGASQKTGGAQPTAESQTKLPSQQSEGLDVIRTNTEKAGLLLECQENAFPLGSAEEKYVRESAAAIRASVRNLATIYRGRDLNFKENDILREVYLTSIKENLAFGTSLKDYAKALPNAVIAGGSGLAFSLISLQYLNAEINSVDVFIISVIAGIVGILLYLIILKISRWRQKQFYIRSDHERNLYYIQYLDRSKKELKELYRELNDIHTKYRKDKPLENLDWVRDSVLGRTADDRVDMTPGNNPEGDEEINNLLESLYPTECRDADQCIYNGMYDPGCWVRCETWGAVKSRDPVKRPCDEKTRMNIRWGLLLLAVIILVPAAFSMFPAILATAPGSVTLTKSPVFSSIDGNGTITVNIVLENAGNTEITDLFIEDTVPETFNYISGDLTASVQSLAPRRSTSLSYTIRPRYRGTFPVPSAKAVFTDRSGEVQEIVSNAPVFEVTLPDPGNVIISKSASPSVLKENQNITVTIAVENTGKNTIRNLTIIDKEPDGFHFVTGDQTLTIPFLKTAESRSIHYTMKSVNAGRYILDPATVQFENIPANRTASKSNSPVVQVIAGFTRTMPGVKCGTSHTVCNETEFYPAMEKFLKAYAGNTTKT
jgi:uncharacterized repeat protein (TIGR01451 family)